MKNTSNKTIPFKPKECNDKIRNSKYKINNKSDTCAKIIPYPKYRYKKIRNIKTFRNNIDIQYLKKNKLLLVILFIFCFFIFISFINTLISRDKYAFNYNYLNPKFDILTIANSNKV